MDKQRKAGGNDRCPHSDCAKARAHQFADPERNGKHTNQRHESVFQVKAIFRNIPNRRNQKHRAANDEPDGQT